MYHSELTVLRCYSGKIKTYPVLSKKQAIKLDLARLETPIQSTAVSFRANKRKSTIHYLSPCHRRVSKHRNHIFGVFFSTNRQEPFFERLTNCMESKANKFFCQSNVHAILNVCWPP